MKDITIFLGANTGRGFRSLYDEFTGSPAMRRLYVIKGSPGCGKSTMMKQLAERARAAGLQVITVLCSGDPDSLDGVILPEKGAAVFDGTSPHVLEPSLVGQRGFYVDLSCCYTSAVQGLEVWDASCKEHYRKAYAWLAAAGSLEEIPRCGGETLDAVRRRADALAARTLGRGRGDGSLRRFFTDAFTFRGPVTLEETRRALAPRLIALSGSGERTEEFFRAYLAAALARGKEVVLCPRPRNTERIAHLLLPELGLGITTGNGDRRIRLDKLGPAPSEAEKAERRELEKLRQSLLDKAQTELVLAKENHDELEKLSRPGLDFGAVSRETERLIRRVLEN